MLTARIQLRSRCCSSSHLARERERDYICGSFKMLEKATGILSNTPDFHDTSCQLPRIGYSIQRLAKHPCLPRVLKYQNNSCMSMGCDNSRTTSNLFPTRVKYPGLQKHVSVFRRFRYPSSRSRIFKHLQHSNPSHLHLLVSSIKDTEYLHVFAAQVPWVLMIQVLLNFIT